jgi:hypothetical protein
MRDFGIGIGTLPYPSLWMYSGFSGLATKVEVEGWKRSWLFAFCRRVDVQY